MNQEDSYSREAVVRIGTYNLRRAVLDESSEDNRWAARASRLVRSMVSCDFDLVGLEEVDLAEQTSIPSMLSRAGKEYGSFFFSPYDESGHGTKAHGLLFKKERYAIGEPYFFWISDPRDKMQVNDLGSSVKGHFIRGGFCVEVEDKANGGQSYFMMVTHAPLNEKQHAENAHVFLEVEKQLNRRGLPSFFVGDFNAGWTDPASVTYRTWWTDSYLFFDGDPHARSGAAGSFNGWVEPEPGVDRRIDYVYFRGEGITPLRYVCDKSLYDGKFASDHFPVYVDFMVQRKGL